MQRIGSRVARFATSAQTFPIAIRDFGMVAARRCANGAAVLLRAREPVRETKVRGDVINLRGRLVVPRTPRDRAVNRADRPLIPAEAQAFGFAGIDPGR